MINAVIKKYECIVCNSPISLHTNTNNFYCKSCNSTTYKNENEALELQIFPVISASTSYIKIGTKGKWNDKEFVVIGRCRLWFEHRTKNYWTILFNDDLVAYLLEYVGFYSILTKSNINLKDTEISLSTLSKNKFYAISATEACKFIAKEATERIDIEGEFYLPKLNDNILVYEFECINNKKLKAIRYNLNLTVLFNEELVEFEHLQLTQTNINVTSKTFDCKNCSNNINIIDIENTQACICNKCNSQYQLKNFSLRFIEKNEIDKNKIYFAVGDILVFDKISYTINGIAIKQDYSIYKSKWREYCLYNISTGYAFLNEFDGHWTLVKELWSKADLEDSLETVIYNDQQFELFNKYNYKTIYSEGEFPYNLFKQNEITCYEYIAPPLMFIKEKNDKEITWFLGKHIDKKELQQQCKNSLPYKSGIGAIDPKYIVSKNKIVIAGLVAILVAIAVHLLSASTKSNTVLIDNYFSLPDSTQIYNTTIPNIYLPKNSSNITIVVNAAVDNSWFQLTANLVNTKDGAEYNIEQGVERYSGYEDGESWSEGSTEEEMNLSQIPSGNYVLNLQTTQDSYRKISGFNVKILYDTAIHRNLWFTILGIGIIALILHWINYNYNYRRWQNSPYFLNKYPSVSND
jgi:Domain of unknown function (DUF4178)